MNVRERFENMFVPEPNTGCSIWIGGLDASGYGRFALNGRNWKASRVAWLLAHSDPKEMHVLHRCDNPVCVNTDHLFLGTNADNIADRMNKGRRRLRLSCDQVAVIRRLRQDGCKVCEIPNETGIKTHLVHSVLYRGWYQDVA